MTMIATIGALLLSWAAVQDPAKQAADEAAAAVVKDYKDKRAKARKDEEVKAAILQLTKANPHPLIRSELISVLDSRLHPDLRLGAAEALGGYAKDRTACNALIPGAYEGRGREMSELRKRCLRAFGAIAPHARSTDLQALFSDPDVWVCREAVVSAGRIRSVRMLGPLVSLLGELERIRDDDIDRGPNPRPPKVDHVKLRRKRELMQPVREALQLIWSKVNAKIRIVIYIQVERLLSEYRADIQKALVGEDRQDRTP
ncbi:MAG TPA: hypothetical protein VFS19_02845 [Planctomycetota bacterium]|nr:hypothetical protein [Planctomycetota bacterium]